MEKREGARNNSTRLVSMTHFSTEVRYHYHTEVVLLSFLDFFCLSSEI